MPLITIIHLVWVHLLCVIYVFYFHSSWPDEYAIKNFTLSYFAFIAIYLIQTAFMKTFLAGRFRHLYTCLILLLLAASSIYCAFSAYTIINKSVFWAILITSLQIILSFYHFLFSYKQNYNSSA